ncbi:MAG: outer membrane protein assembly factor BamA [Hyphomicrobiales bacterium]|nr:outer membrane protein assembly factor BamA [Hyphomicrobiales bacterium]MDE2016553.1 outer membrane protein assembly factor BamA [Hyphomicrobiales bacterium]
MTLVRDFLGRVALVIGLLIAVFAAGPASAQAVLQPSAAEGKTINRVFFEGASNVKPSQLRVEVDSKVRNPFKAAVATADLQRIKDVYGRAGRSAASVTYRVVAVPNGTVDVVFTIDEGGKTGVRKIDFVGNQAYSSDKLRGLMATTTMNFLSWFKTTDVYDPDRLNADVEKIRAYYEKNGYADFKITGVDAKYSPTPDPGYYITISVSEGPQYRVSGVNVVSRVPGVDAAALQNDLQFGKGDVYDADLVQKSSEAISRDAVRTGNAFAQVRPTGTRDAATHTISMSLVVENGPPVYVERINITGNTRTRDYVIRREFELGEGDPYNPVLVAKAERRLKALGYFKNVRITTAPGSSPDRVVINVDVQDQPTGAFKVFGGYSTTDGFSVGGSITEKNFLGRGQAVSLSASVGQYSRGVDLSFTEPYFLDRRMSATLDLFSKQTSASSYSYYTNTVTGFTVAFGLPINDQLSFQPHYSLFNSNVSIPNTTTQPYNDCTVSIPNFTPGDPGNPTASATNNCLLNGEASLALKDAVGNRLTSMIGYSLTYNSLDDVNDPHDGIYAKLTQDVAGLGGAAHFIRTTADARYYRSVTDDLVGIARVQGGNVIGYDGKLGIFDQFNMGPELVRGFAPGGIGPRDITVASSANGNALGGTTYFGASLEAQFPLPGLPKEVGLKGALFADAGTLFGYGGKTNFGNGAACTYPSTTNFIPGNVAGSAGVNGPQGTCITVGDDHRIRSSVGASILWASPLGPIRFDYAFVLTKGANDVTQNFRFSGGSSF